jgi:hypothetical protein
MLTELNPEKVCFIVVKAREYDAQDETPIDDASDAADDGFVAVFTQGADPSVRREAAEFIDAMNVDEQTELVALCLVGRGDYDASEWREALAAARSRPMESASAYLLGMPNVGDLLEEGLAAFDLSCAGYAPDRL